MFMRVDNVVVSGTDILVTACQGKFVALYRRTIEPYFSNKFVMPGGPRDLIYDYNLEHACSRICGEKFGIYIKPKMLAHLITLSDRNRDPRADHNFDSTVFTFDFDNIESLNKIEPQINANVREVCILEVSILTPEDMGFDHWLAIEALKRKYDIK